MKLLAKYEGLDLGVPNKLVGFNLTATDKGIALDQSRYAEIIVLEGMGSTEVGKVHTPLDHGIDLSTREEHEEELDV